MGDYRIFTLEHHIKLVKGYDPSIMSKNWQDELIMMEVGVTV